MLSRMIWVVARDLFVGVQGVPSDCYRELFGDFSQYEQQLIGSKNTTFLC